MGQQKLIGFVILVLISFSSFSYAQSYHENYWIIKNSKEKLSRIEIDTTLSSYVKIEQILFSNPEIEITDSMSFYDQKLYVLHEGGFNPAYFYLQGTGIILISYHDYSYRFLFMRKTTNIFFGKVSIYMYYNYVDAIVNNTSICNLFIPPPGNASNEW
ncbi:MAG: hypothetical protein PF448_10075 [Bacteroidales bacterium]|jgi:hypothetical protein|nr:hypothetical protein [Bacteroidales bacterium]